MNQDGVFHYHLLRVSLQRFEKNFVTLDSKAAADEVQRIARQTFALEEKVLASDEARDCVIDAQQLTQAVAQVRDRYPDQATFVADLNANHLNEKKLREALQRELVFDAVMRQIATRSAAVSELDVQSYYQRHQERFIRPETREARHLLITVNPDFAENTRPNASQRIEKLAGILSNNPDQFAELAARHSECPTALEGGKLGQVKPGQLDATVEQALFQLPAGNVSPIVESPLGFHLVLCEGIYPAQTLAFEEVREAIRQRLMAHRAKQCQQSWIRSL
jgi:peptidyl-prolyl cis-trans isomerase C